MSSLQKRYALPIIRRPTYIVKARNLTKMEISGHVYMHIYRSQLTRTLYYNSIYIYIYGIVNDIPHNLLPFKNDKMNR